MIAVHPGRAGSSDRHGRRPQGVMMNRWWLGWWWWWRASRWSPRAARARRKAASWRGRAAGQAYRTNRSAARRQPGAGAGRTRRRRPTPVRCTTSTSTTIRSSSTKRHARPCRRMPQWLKDHPTARVEIEGHCDDRGTVEYNLALGAKRAAAAKNYLVDLGHRSRSHDDDQLRRGAAALPGGDRGVLEPQPPRPLRAGGRLSAHAAPATEPRRARARRARRGERVRHARRPRARASATSRRCAHVSPTCRCRSTRSTGASTRCARRVDEKGGGRDSATVRDAREADRGSGGACLAVAAADRRRRSGAVPSRRTRRRRTSRAPRPPTLRCAARIASRRTPANERTGARCRPTATGRPISRSSSSASTCAATRKSDLADNAQYWIGEAYYSKGDYNRSIIELNEVLLKYPQGDQVPGALLALATSFSELGRHDRRQAHPAEADQRPSQERRGRDRAAAAADADRLAPGSWIR